MRGLMSGLIIMMVALAACAQQAPKQETPKPETKAAEQTAEQKPEAKRLLTPSARLDAAKTAYVKSGAGSDMPYEIVRSALESWPRFMLVDSAEKADIVVEVSAPEEGSGVSVTSTTDTNSITGRPEQKTTSKHEFSPSRVKVVITDVKSKMTLWTANEPVKGAMRQKQRDDNVVAATERVVQKLHDRVEPVKQ